MCLANDTGYENIFSGQLDVLASPGDVLVVLSGSGNSPNILRALESANRIGMGYLGHCGIQRWRGFETRQKHDPLSRR
jgi:phosphoheptose isomerase